MLMGKPGRGQVIEADDDGAVTASEFRVGLCRGVDKATGAHRYFSRMVVLKEMKKILTRGCSDTYPSHRLHKFACVFILHISLPFECWRQHNFGVFQSYSWPLY